MVINTLNNLVLLIGSFILYIVSWEPEGRYCRSKMFCWEPEGRYCHWLCTAIVSFWFSMEHLWAAITPFWLSTDDMQIIMQPRHHGRGGGNCSPPPPYDFLLSFYLFIFLFLFFLGGGFACKLRGQSFCTLMIIPHLIMKILPLFSGRHFATPNQTSRRHPCIYIM